MNNGRIAAALAMLSCFGAACASQSFSTHWNSVVAGAALSPPSTESWFGASNALWRDPVTGEQWAVVGAPIEDGSTGAVYVFRLAPDETDWHQEARLAAPDGAPLDEFGYTVAIDGGTIAIGAPVHMADFFDGAVYLFVRDPLTSKWMQQGDALSATVDEFGYSLALRGDTLAVGDPECECVQTYARAGSVWSPEIRLSAPADLTFSGFGFSVAMIDDHLLVGAPFDNAVADSQGAAVLYSRSREGWDEQQILRPEIDTSAMQDFGYAVALSSDSIVVGAPAQSAYRGSAHTFVYDGVAAVWREQSLLRSASGASKPQFGESLSMSGDLLAIGAPAADSAEIYRLRGGAWTRDSVLKGDRGSYFGYSLAADNGDVLVGAPMSGDVLQGAAYVFVGD